jgi:hypothetical protein
MPYDPALSLALMNLVAAKPAGEMPVDRIHLPGYSTTEIQEHLKLLIDENLVFGNVQFADNEVFDILVTRPTLKGYQFLEITRDSGKWKKFMELAQAGIGFVTREGFRTALAELIKSIMS